MYLNLFIFFLICKVIDINSKYAHFFKRFPVDNDILTKINILLAIILEKDYQS